MPQSTRRTFATGIILVILVNGLVVAQKYTGYQGNPDSLLYPDSDDERSNPSPAKRVVRDSQLSVNRCTLINLRSDHSSARISDVARVNREAGLCPRARGSHHSHVLPVVK